MIAWRARRYYVEHSWTASDPLVTFVSADTPQLIGIMVPDRTFAGNAPHPLNDVCVGGSGETYPGCGHGPF